MSIAVSAVLYQQTGALTAGNGASETGTRAQSLQITASPTGFSASAVSIDISSAAATSDRDTDLRSAIDTLKQTNAEAKDFQKGAAQKRLDLAVKELALLKLLGTGLSAVREAVRLAKEIAAAAEEYGGATSGGNSAITAIGASDASAAEAAASSASGQTASGQTASGQTASGQTAGGTPAASASVASAPTAEPATTASGPDPFYAEAEGALAAIRKYLRDALPALKSSPLQKTREEANELENSFNSALDATFAAAQASVGASTGSVNIYA